MAYQLIFVLDNPDQCSDILDAWEKAGAPGITILESTGLGRLQGTLRDDLPLIPSMSDLLTIRESHHRTLFSVIGDEETLEQVINATKRIIGDFNRHHTGLLFVVPVTHVFGLEKRGEG